MHENHINFFLLCLMICSNYVDHIKKKIDKISRVTCFLKFNQEKKLMNSLRFDRINSETDKEYWDTLLAMTSYLSNRLHECKYIVNILENNTQRISFVWLNSSYVSARNDATMIIIHCLIEMWHINILVIIIIFKRACTLSLIGSQILNTVRYNCIYSEIDMNVIIER